jgi:tetratricopeptide (TPR) repeat protein
MLPETELPVFERFAVQRRLGSGGFGVVYQAFDRKRKMTVALKTLRRADASLYYLKQEFRSLSGIVHRNLVTLYELVDERDQWFLTMELVEGVPFVDHLRSLAGPYASTSSPTLSLEFAAEHTAAVAAEPARQPVAIDYDLLRRAMLQLADGLGAIHDAGKLHLDIKPSNVLVETSGRVVVLDFGLATDEDTAPPGHEIGGTPAYMAPEQKAGTPSVSSDWFAVGVMLYQCLTGQLPPSGTGPGPILFDPGTPADLSQLCLELLNPNAAGRAGRDRVLRLLSRDFVASPAAPQIFVGRGRELGVLREAYRATSRGSAVVVRIRGASGIGKSALAREFRREIRARHPDALLLPARCFDRESVRYKAVDGVVDGITRFLRPLPAAECAQLLPRDIVPLARLFPVLRRVEAVTEARRRTEETLDTQELRRRAFVALREMLARMAVVRPVAVFIDDLQWSDLESVPLLETVLRNPDSPALLLVASYRDEVESNPVLRRLAPILAVQGPEIALSDLSRAEARDLALTLAPEDVADDVVRQAGGNPFLIGALLRHGSPAGPARSVDLDDVIRCQIASLPARARTLVEVLAVAARPVAPRALGELADESLLPLLVSERLVRSRGADEELEIYHDRIRETVSASLGEGKLRAHHLLLARSYSALPDAEPETVALHFQAAGETAAAAPYAETAADQASQALAFDRAARLYRLALESARAPEHVTSLRRRLGDSLSDAGHAREAAEAYRLGAETAGPSDQIDLLRLSAERLLVSGHFDEGYGTMRGVLRTFGIELAPTPGAGLRSLLWRRAWLALRGLRFRSTPAERIDPGELLRIDAILSAVGAFGRIEPILGMECQARLLMRALRAGEPVRLARCLALEVVISSFGGDRAWTNTERALRLCERMIEQTGDAQAAYSLAGTSGLASFFRGRWEEALAKFDVAERMRRPSGSGSAWEVTVRRLCTMFCWFFSGDLSRLVANLPDWLSDCRARADMYMEVSLLCRCSHLPLLAADRPEGAEEIVGAAILRWSQQGYHWQHVWSLIALTEIDLYCGRTGQCWERIVREWPLLVRSLVLKVQFSNIEMRHLRARAALAHAAAGNETRRLCAIVLKDAAALERENTPWSLSLALLLRAGVERVLGRPYEGTLRRAEKALTESGTRLYAAAAMRYLGEIAGDDALARSAEEVLCAQGIRNPAQMSRVLAPGLAR